MEDSGMKKYMTLFLIILIAWLPYFIGAWDNTLPSDSIAWNIGAGDIRNNNDALEVVLGVGLTMEGSASPWYESSTPTTTADLSTALAVGNNGLLWVDSDDGSLKYYVHGTGFASIAAGGTISARPGTLEQRYQFILPSPISYQAVDTEWCIDASTRAAMTITRIEITMEADPTTEMDWDLKFADAFIGLASATLIVAMDTTNGTASITSFTDATIPTGKCIYFSFGAAPDAAALQVQVTIYWDYD